MLATAVVDLWPGTKVSIGPAIESGFYYDFEFPDDFRPSEDDLARIEEAMAKHVAADEEFERSDVPVGGGASSASRPRTSPTRSS